MCSQDLQIPPVAVHDEHEIGQRLRDGQQPLLAALEIGSTFGDPRLELRRVPLHALPELRLPDGDGQDAREFARHRHLFRVDRPPVFEAHGEGAHEVALGPQRHRDARAQAVVPQQRRAGIVVGHLLEHAHLAGAQVIEGAEARERRRRARRRRGQAGRRLRGQERARVAAFVEDREVGAAARHQIGRLYASPFCHPPPG